MAYGSFKEMPVWQKAMEVAETLHSVTEALPKKEDYGFTSQVRRAALSISANIAEAYGRKHILDKINFYYHARGSVTETQSHLEYGKRVRYLETQETEQLDGELVQLYHQINKIVSELRELKKKMEG
jgi:four helix bundle protein